MTEGAKTGTDELPEWAINAAEKVMLRISQDRPEAALAMIGKSYIAAQIIVDECPLTEALKVAGELAVDYARHQSLCNGALGGRYTCGLDDKRAALERIRNKTP